MASTSSASLPVPPVFKGENYDFWSVKMKAFFLKHDLWKIVETGYQPTELGDDPTVAEIIQAKGKSTKNFKALSFIHSAVTEVIFPRIVGATTAKQAWDTL